MGSQYCHAEFDYPLQFLQTLLDHGYELNEMEEKCFNSYAFMEKISTFLIDGSNMIETICKNNS